ncbi:NADH:flavin oxidoreductase/NADH oxidase [Aliibacillus thermotolerans]|uniref:NADH:flavin oxidoreductase/NADH oxidase n=1 Tax=Aliibacillus thermotolerans TaxID=1834418 RepID=A0ABW0U2R8_9BACI|nr:NADH:flavin oxidoreductase/NADH oxidase [Aliibacillus thermotolerans]MDA3128514.1 NADPH dehydrogenase [Aliibacillus thermotolerans]
MNKLFSPFRLKGLELKNRVVMSPMCQYSVTKEDGTPNDWHFQHYVSRAVGGAGLILLEMTDVDPDGRITNGDLGIWSDEHVETYAKLVEAVHQHGAKIGIQIAHAGRKAEDAEEPVAPSAIPFGENFKTPRALETEEVIEMVEKFRLGIRRAVQAGFDVIELHGAHGYLIHQFLSPFTNHRTDEYGEDRTKFGKEIIAAAKEEMPEDMPLFMRISAVEYAEGGYGIEESLAFAKVFKEAGVDLFDVSTGGEAALPREKRPYTYDGYQVPYARRIKHEVDVPVAAVGRLSDPILAHATVANGDADLICIGRGFLNNPYWALHAARQLKQEIDVPKQYHLAFLK